MILYLFVPTAILALLSVYFIDFKWLNASLTALTAKLPVFVSL